MIDEGYCEDDGMRDTAKMISLMLTVSLEGRLQTLRMRVPQCTSSTQWWSCPGPRERSDRGSMVLVASGGWYAINTHRRE